MRRLRTPSTKARRGVLGTCPVNPPTGRNSRPDARTSTLTCGRSLLGVDALGGGERRCERGQRRPGCDVALPSGLPGRGQRGGLVGRIEGAQVVRDGGRRGPGRTQQQRRRGEGEAAAHHRGLAAAARRERQVHHGRRRGERAGGDDPGPDPGTVRHEVDREAHADHDRRHHDDGNDRCVLTHAPGQRETETAQRGHRRRQRRQVVRVEDLRRGEEAPGPEQPDAPEQRGGAPGVGAGLATARHEDRSERDQRGQEEPCRVATQGSVEEAGRSPGERHRGGTAGRRRRHGEGRRRAAGLVEHVAGEAVGAVVEEDLAEDGVVAAAVDVGPVVCRHEGDDAHPAQRHGEHDEEREGDVAETTGQAGGGRGEDVGEVERRQDQPGLEHLGLEGQADPDAGDDEGLQAAGREGGSGGVGREHEQEHEQRVRDVAPVEQDRDRRDGQCDGRGEAGTGAGDAAHGAVEDEHGQRSFHDLGQHDGPDVEAEDPQGERLDPECARELVDRDGAPGVEGPEEEVVPTLRHAPRRGAVEGLEEGAAHAPAVRECRQRGHGQERGPGPPGLVGRRAPELPRAPLAPPRVRRSARRPSRHGHRV